MVPPGSTQMKFAWLPVVAILVVGACGPGSGRAGDAVCGDGRIQLGETCDGASCPTACDERGTACMLGRLEGSAATCNAVCVYDEQTACVHGDGCCAPGC